MRISLVCMESAAVIHTLNITVLFIHLSISLSLSFKYLPIKWVVKQQNPEFGKIILLG